MIVPQPASFQIAWLVTSALNSLRDADDVQDGQVVLHQEGVEHAGVAEHLLEQGDHDHPGQEVRKVEDGLQQPLEPLAGQTVEQQRQDEGHREDQHRLDHRQDQGVPEGVEELGVTVPQECEVRESHPLGLREPKIWLIVLERDDVAQQWQVVEEYERQRAGNSQQQHEHLVPGQLSLVMRGRGPLRCVVDDCGGRPVITRRSW